LGNRKKGFAVRDAMDCGYDSESRDPVLRGFIEAGPSASGFDISELPTAVIASCSMEEIDKDEREFEPRQTQKDILVLTKQSCGIGSRVYHKERLNATKEFETSCNTG